MKQAPGTHDEVVRPSTVVRRIIGRDRLAGFVKRRDAPGLAFAAAHLALLGVGGWALWSVSGTFWAIPATVMHGIIIVHLFAPFHESTHYTAFRTRWLNSVTGWISGLLLMLPPTAFRYEHTAHHKYTQDPDLDPQMIPDGESQWGFWCYASAIPYFRNILAELVRHPFGRLNQSERRNVPATQHGTLVRESRIFWCVYGLVATISVFFESWLAAQLWLLPRIAGEPFMRVIRMSEHVGCARVPNMLETRAPCSPSRRFGFSPGTWPITPHTMQCPRRPSSGSRHSTRSCASISRKPATDTSTSYALTTSAWHADFSHATRDQREASAGPRADAGHAA